MGINGLKDNIPMTTIEIQIKEKNEILKGLEKTYETLLEFKKSKNSELVVLLNNKIVKIKPTTL
jgi:sulfur carrier protein ThiS